MTSPQRFAILIGLCLTALVPAARAAEPAAAASDADVAFFETKVRPLLVERCYKCHSHAEGKDKGGLYVDSRAALLAGGDNGPSVVPGDPAKSKLIEAVSYANVDLQMPPKAKLADAEIATLTEWVKRGAPWPAGEKATAVKSSFDIARLKAEHWAWQPVRPVDPPAVKDAIWAATLIDRFVLAKLEANGLTPANRADKRTLIRRATFAITGLPPTRAEVEAFVADASPDAFAKVVDRLLASPGFGERWGRHWLDVVRFAETRGHEFDYLVPNAWQYRDYVTRALNADVPYDQFVKEHVAGDLLPKPRLSADGVRNESVIATGFWFLNEWVHSPVDIRQDEVERVDNQIDVFAKAFNGMTLGCARCHDHKFDAISAKDYYALAGFLHSSSYRDVAFEHQAHNAAVAERLRAYEDKVGRQFLSAATGPAKTVLDRLPAYLNATGEAVRDPKALLARDGLDPAVVAAWTAELRAAAKDPTSPFGPLAAAMLDPRSPGSAARDAVTNALRANRETGVAFRSVVVDYATLRSGHWIADGPAFGAGPRPVWALSPGRSPGQWLGLADGTAAVAEGHTNLPGKLRTPTFTITAPTLSMYVSGVGRAFICIDSHRMIEGPLHKVSNQSIKAGDRWLVQTADLSGYLGQRAHVEFAPADGARLAVRWVKQGAEAAPPVTRVIATGEPAFSEEDTYAEVIDYHVALVRNSWSGLTDLRRREGANCEPALADHLLRRPALLGLTTHLDSPETKAALTAYAAGRQQILADLRPSATAMAMLDGSAYDERVLIRGSHKTPGDVVPRRYLEAVDGPAAMNIDRGSGRLALAERLVDPANPLTARVVVNRVWHHLFGRGIVASTDNFGVLGDQPTHPELLDHLADGFVKDGWSVKRLIRRVMLTSAWQMTSAGGGAADEADPQNLLLHRQNLRRLEGEAIRDGMLAVSGRLDPTLYGPGVEVHLTAFMDGRGRPGSSGPLDGNGRRSLYTRVRRNFLSPMMLAFDTPQPFNTMGRRSVSNVPAQALILMNDPFVVAQAQAWAKRVFAGPGKTPEQRVDDMYRTAFARPATATETATALGFIDSQGAELGIDERKRCDDPRVWADFAHVLMNVKEFVYVP